MQRLIKEGFLKEDKVKDETVVALTGRGRQYLEENEGEKIGIILRESKELKGVAAKQRQIRLAYSLAMLHPISPQYDDDYTSFLQSKASFSSLNINRDKKVLDDRVASIQEEIKRRGSGNWILTTREMRSIDIEQLKNMSAVRAQGLCNISGVPYVFYNQMGARMRGYGDFEHRYRDFCLSVLGADQIDCISFAKSYKVALNVLKSTRHEDRQYYVATMGLYNKQFYVPLTAAGTKQLAVIAKPRFRETLGRGLFKEDDVERARLSVFDARTELDDCDMYLGVECDLNDLTRLYYFVTGPYKYKEKHIRIYCFEHQTRFYQDLFADTNSKVELIELNYEKIIEALG